MAESKVDKALQQLINMFGDRTKIEKVWENASPTSIFNAQTINLELYVYTHVLLQYYIVKEDANGLQSVIVPVGSYGSMSIASSVNRLRVFQVSSTGIVFKAGNYWPVYGQGSEVDNTWLTPYRVYGIKGVA